MAGIAITRRELTAAELTAAAGRTKDARAGCRRSRWCWRALTARQRRRPAGWTVRRCGEADQKTLRRTVSPPNGHRTNAEVWPPSCTRYLSSVRLSNNRWICRDGATPISRRSTSAQS